MDGCREAQSCPRRWKGCWGMPGCGLCLQCGHSHAKQRHESAIVRRLRYLLHRQSAFSCLVACCSPPSRHPPLACCTLSCLTRLSAAADRSNALLPTFTARLLCYAFCSPQPSALLQASFPPVPPYCRRLDFGGCCVRRASGCILDGGHVRSGGRLFPCARDHLHCTVR